MIPDLIEYADKIGIDPTDPSEEVFVEYAIRFKKNGEFEGANKVGSKKDKKIVMAPKIKAYRVRKLKAALSAAGSKGMAGSHFLCCSFKEFSDEEKCAFHVQELKLYSKAVGKKEIEKVAETISSNHKEIVKALTDEGCKEANKLTISINNVLIVDDVESWKPYWSKRLLELEVIAPDDDELEMEGRIKMPSQVTGALITPVAMHDVIKISGLGIPTGTKLVSFNNECHSSYGLFKGQHSPISRSDSLKYTLAMDDLGKRALRIGSGIRCLHWTDSLEPCSIPEFLMFGAHRPKDEEHAIQEDANKTYAYEPKADFNNGKERIVVGRGRAAHAPTQKFHILIISAESRARLTVRKYMVKNLKDIEKNIDLWKKDLSLNGVLRDESIFGLAHSAAKGTIVDGAEFFKSQAFSNIMLDLFMAAINGGPISKLINDWCMKSYVHSLFAGKRDEESKSARATQCKAAGLLKAFFNRTARKNKEIELMPELSQNKDHQSQSFQLGRLFACYCYTQRSAMPQVKASLETRFIGQAVKDPTVVISACKDKNSHHHRMLQKDRRGGLSVHIQRIQSEICGRIEIGVMDGTNPSASWHKPPAFVLGFEQQIGDFYKPSAKRSTDSGESTETKEETTIETE